MIDLMQEFRRTINTTRKTGETYGNSYYDIRSLVDFIIDLFDRPEIILFAYRQKDKGDSLEQIIKSTVRKALQIH